MEVRRRRIRISFSDPDATDSDSGEDANSNSSCGKTTKIVILHCSSSSSRTIIANKKNPAGGCGSSQQKQAMAIRSSASCRERALVGPAPAVMKRCRGVYERQPGRWAAEFRSHRLKARHWIGTFATEAEAKAAYDDFERHFVPSRRCGLPPLPAMERGGRGRAAGVCRPSPPHGPHRQRHPPDEKRQIVQALPATGIMLPPLPSAPSSSPCVSNSTSASPLPLPVPAPPTPFENTQPHADALPVPLPSFSDGSMDFDPADLLLFDGFL